MHEKVHSAEDGSHRVGIVHAVHSVDKHRDVMVPVEEGKTALAQDYERCVAQLEEFGEAEEIAPDGDTRNAVHVSKTDSVVHAVRVDGSQDTRQDSDCAQNAKHSQSNVPQDQRLLQVVWLSVLHPFPPLVDQQEVDGGGVETDCPGTTVEGHDARRVGVILNVPKKRQRYQGRHDLPFRIMRSIVPCADLWNITCMRISPNDHGLNEKGGAIYRIA